jgi:23S rRNA G2069 N7-methylase RlmK/C1962 C5-methylase RlmI
MNLQHDNNPRIDIYGLIIRNLEQIKPYLERNNIIAYRLINNTSRLFPLTVDIYQDNAVIHVFNDVAPEVLTELEKQLKATFNVVDFFYKDRSKDKLTLPNSPPKKIVVEEYGNKFLVNLSDYLDTGLFLDHRETRKWIGGQSRDKIVLNTFAYSGSFSVYAANSGASKT